MGRALMKNGDKEMKLNFPYDEIEVWAEKKTSPKYVGLSWIKSKSKWRVERWSKVQGTNVYNGYFNRDEEMRAAHASDDLARKLKNAGEEGHKLNFSENAADENSKKRDKKRKRTNDFELQND